MKVLEKQEGQLRYQRAKARRQIGVEKEAVNILKWGVERDRSVVERREETNSKRTDTLIMEEAALWKNRDRLGKDKLVFLCPFLLTFYSLASPIHWASSRFTLTT
jgi:hypothetical protein